MLEACSTAPRWRRGHRAALAALLVVAMVLPVALGHDDAEAASGPACASAPMDVDFRDVARSGTFADAIRCVAGYGLVGGFHDGTFRPGEQVTRGQAAVFLLNAVETATGVQLPGAGSNPFSDVNPSSVFGQAILRLQAAGVVSGRTSSRYRPEDALTRGEMSRIVTRALQAVDVVLDGADVDYPDVPDSGTFAGPIAKLTNARIVQGLSDGTFRPGAAVTRGQLAVFVANGIEEANRQDLWLPLIDDPAWTSLRGTLQHRRVSLPGPRVVNVLRWKLDDPQVKLDVDYAGGPTHRATVQDAAQKHDAIAAVNAGFWVHGVDPDGLLVRGGRLDSDTSVTTNGSRNIRSGFALHRDDTPVVGIPRWYGGFTLQREDGTHVHKRIDGVNRAPFPDDDVVLYAPGTYAELNSRVGRWFVVRGVPKLTANSTQELQVVRAHAGPGPVQASADESVIWVSPDTGTSAYPDAHVEDTPTLRINDLPPEWENVRTGLVAGPWLLTGGQVTSEAQWRSEGFPASHTDVRHPRSAIGFTPDGWGVIVTVDGRRPGATVGSTQVQVAQMMKGWGVTEAIMLDGGGSTQLAIRGTLANRPCCDLSTRKVATVLTLEPR